MEAEGAAVLAELWELRQSINATLKRGDFDAAGTAIAQAVPKLLSLPTDQLALALVQEACSDNAEAGADRDDVAAAQKADDEAAGPATGTNARDSDDFSCSPEPSSSSDDDDGQVPLITSYRYRSMLHRMPHSERLEAVCTWLYDSVVHGNAPG
jgi:hypothetical protein